MGISSELWASGWSQTKDLLWKKVIHVTVLFNHLLQSTPVVSYCVHHAIRYKNKNAGLLQSSSYLLLKKKKRKKKMCFILQSSLTAERHRAEHHRLMVVSYLKNAPQSIPEIWSEGLDQYKGCGDLDLWAQLPNSSGSGSGPSFSSAFSSICPSNIIEMPTDISLNPSYWLSQREYLSQISIKASHVSTHRYLWC